MGRLIPGNSSSSPSAHRLLAVRAEAIFRFNCFNVEDSHDPSVGLEFGELAIPGRVLKTEVFDPVIGSCSVLLDQITRLD